MWGLMLIKTNSILKISLYSWVHFKTSPSALAAAAFSLRESFARRYGRVGDFLPNDGSRAPKVQGGVNGYLSVM